VSEHLREQWRAAAKTALPSWRPYSDDFWTWFDCVLAPDIGRERAYDIYTHGVLVARRPSLGEAKEYVEEVYGPLQFEFLRLADYPVMHPWYGRTTEFTDPKFLWIVRTLPTLGDRQGGSSWVV
jgi:hypothetical protein